MRIERQKRQSNWPLVGCGCATALAGLLAVAGVGFILLIGLLPDITLRLSGFSPKGETETIFEAATPLPTVEVVNPVTPPEVVVDLGAYGAQEIPAATSDYTIVIGSSETGSPL